MADLVLPGGSPLAILNEGAMPDNIDMRIYKGDYVEVFVTIQDNDGDPIDLTGWTASAQLKKNYADTAPVDFTCELTGTVGEVRIYLPSTASSTLVAGGYIYDFQLENPDGDARTYMVGDVLVYDEVTT